MLGRRSLGRTVDSDDGSGGDAYSATPIDFRSPRYEPFLRQLAADLLLSSSSSSTSTYTSGLSSINTGNTTTTTNPINTTTTNTTTTNATITTLAQTDTTATVNVDTKMPPSIDEVWWNSICNKVTTRHHHLAQYINGLLLLDQEDTSSSNNNTNANTNIGNKSRALKLRPDEEELCYQASQDELVHVANNTMLTAIGGPNPGARWTTLQSGSEATWAPNLETGTGARTKRIKTLQEAATDSVFSALRETLNGSSAAATFACGGEVTVSTHGVTMAFRPRYSQQQQQKNSDAGLVFSEIKFGGVKQPSGGMQDVLEALVEACEPAKFGFKGEDVLDQTYRRALQLDPGEFITDFHPYDHGIVDVIQQMLLPGVGTPGNIGDRDGPRVVVELYKFNVSWALS